MIATILPAIMSYLRPFAILLFLCFAQLIQSIAISGALGGVDTATGQRPFRQEFSTFAISGPAFDLYILALQCFQQLNQTNGLSYYQVAGMSSTILPAVDLVLTKI